DNRDSALFLSHTSSSTPYWGNLPGIALAIAIYHCCSSITFQVFLRVDTGRAGLPCRSPRTQRGVGRTDDRQGSRPTGVHRPAWRRPEELQLAGACVPSRCPEMSGGGRHVPT